MGFARVFVITSMLVGVGVVLDVIPVQLPHPACHHRTRPLSLHEKPGSTEGEYKPNTALQSVKRQLQGQIRGPESLAFSPSGELIFVGDKFGGIFTGSLVEAGEGVEIKLQSATPVLHTVGRPLGLHALSESELLVCDSVSGLLHINLTSKTTSLLTNHAKSHPRRHRTSKIVYANDLDVGADGVVYFTDSTDIPVEKNSEGYYSTFRSYVLNLMEGGATGRLLSYDPRKNTTTELLPKLWYANGVAVEKEGEFVAVVETNGFRVHRFWLKGSKAGTADLLISNLPGFPDGISTAPDGNFWIALNSPPLPFWSLLEFRILRLVLAWVTEYVTFPHKRWGYVLKVTPQGKVLTVLADAEGGFISDISSAEERNGKLFLGNLVEDYIGVFDLALLQTTLPDQEVSSKEEL